MAEKTQFTSVYQGRATVVFHVGKHFYTVAIPGVHDRLYQPGVTSILGIKDKPALIPWAVKTMKKRALAIAKDIYATGGVVDAHMLGVILGAAEDSWREEKDDSAQVGKAAHAALEGYLNTGAMPDYITINPILNPGFTQEMADKANASVRAGLQFFKENDVKVLSTEAPRWSPKFGYIGTGDLIALVGGHRSVLDFKSGKGIYPEYRLQTVAYGQAWEEEFPDQPIEFRTVVRVGTDGKLEHKSYDRTTWNEDFIAFRALFAAWKWERANGNWPKDAIEVIGDLDKLIPRPL